MSFATEFSAYLRRRRKFYLILICAMLLVIGGLIVLTEGSAVAPFVYTLF